MSEVKRWTLWMVSESGCELEPYSEESPDGTYIKASDYDQLKAENERLREQLNKARRLLKSVQIGMYAYLDEDAVDAWLEANKP